MVCFHPLGLALGSVLTGSGKRCVMDTFFPEDARADSLFRPVDAAPKVLANLTRVVRLS